MENNPIIPTSIEALEKDVNNPAISADDKVDRLNQLSRHLLESFPTRSLELACNGLQIAESCNYIAGQAKSRFSMGLYYSRSRNYKQAFEEFFQALQLNGLINDERGVADAYSKMGNICLYEGNYPDARNYYNEALAIRTKLNDGKGIADLNSNIGSSYYFQENYALSLKSHLSALHTYQKLNDNAYIASSYTNIGNIYQVQKNYDEALTMFEKALKIREKNNDRSSIGDLLNNIGNVFYETGKLQEALEYHSRVLKIMESLGDKTRIANSYNNLANVYKNLDMADLALQYYEMALNIRTELHDKRGMAELYVSLGDLFLRNNDYDKAEHYLNTALQMANDAGAKHAMRGSLLDLSKLAENRKDFEKAYDYYVKYSSADKEITSAEISRQLTQMTMQYEIDRREHETELERSKKEELKKAFDALDLEKKRSEDLLHNILPEEIADEIKQTGKSEARHYDMVTVLFADIMNFTKISEILSPQELLNNIDTCFRNFDLIIEKYGVEKIKVIGDAYMCAGGIPVPNKSNPIDVVNAALEMQEFLKKFALEQEARKHPIFQFRMGINTGPLIAGIVGLKKFAYDVWGDTVNIAARMESSGEAGKVNISGSTYELIKDQFTGIPRGKIEAKNKGLVDMYFVEKKFVF